ncbi:MAG: glycosyltransferase family 2 protein [Candidatus Levybacteria bacterium]|nr:glycosyltransferase family 2 protein [Candidatus Levybacteria bacterium]
MQNKLPELTLFFPFWNEEKNVKHVVESAIPIMKDVADEWEILIIDDGSSDNTYEIGKELARKYRNVRAITHSPNRGYGAALREGFDNARYKYIVFTDGDRQFDFAEITKFIDEIKGADIVIGFRKKRRDKFVRHVLMYMLKIWDFIFFRFYFKDIDCGFKMFRKSAFAELAPLRSEGAMITTEILAKATRKKLKIKEVEVSHYPREFGDQSGANIAVVVRAVLESFILWFDIHNKRI